MNTILGGATVYAKDLARVSVFYERVFGLEVVERDPTFAVLERGSLQVVIVQVPDHVAADIVIADPPQRREDTALKLVFVVPGIASSRATAQALGGVIDATDREWAFRGMRVCDGHDPEGNVIQVREIARDA